MTQSIGFIGTGVMGRSMAMHLLKAGYSVSIYTRTKDKADDLIKEGAVWRETAEELARNSDVVMTMVGYPSDVEELYLGDNGILNAAKTGSYVIDMTTSKPSLAIRIYELAKQKGIYAIDAPVSGGDVGAKEARLSIMAGGDKEAFEACLPIFSIIGKNIVYQGPAGSGQHTKMCNQIAIAAGMIGVSEAIAYAHSAGLDPENVLKSISAGAAGSWSLSNLAPRMLKEDFEPGFYVKHFLKDMSIAIEEAEQLKMEVPGLALAHKLYTELSEKGEAESGTQALYKLWKSSSEN
ncbi:3-hydroxyisobutyrate dehydrogenase [Metabacillus sp. SLBN-84]